MEHPCIHCGACCAHFRVSFYWGESDFYASSGVPSEMTQHLDDFRLTMKGTHCSPPRCVALHGRIGNAVHCGIYDRRASVCRDFEPSWENGNANTRCDTARVHFGLPPLTPEVWGTARDRFVPKSAAPRSGTSGL